MSKNRAANFDRAKFIVYPLPDVSLGHPQDESVRTFYNYRALHVEMPAARAHANAVDTVAYFLCGRPFSKMVLRCFAPLGCDIRHVCPPDCGCPRARADIERPSGSKPIVSRVMEAWRDYTRPEPARSNGGNMPKVR